MVVGRFFSAILPFFQIMLKGFGALFHDSLPSSSRPSLDAKSTPENLINLDSK